MKSRAPSAYATDQDDTQYEVYVVMMPGSADFAKESVAEAG